MALNIIKIIVPWLLALGVFTQTTPLVDNGDGTVTDPSTGLMWLQDSLPPSGSADYKTWDEAMDWAKNLRFACYDDWRLPSGKDVRGVPQTGFGADVLGSEFGDLFLTSLGTPANQNEIVPLGYYPPSFETRYWTSTENFTDSTKAIAFLWSYELEYSALYYDKNETMRYTAVRDTQTPEGAICFRFFCRTYCLYPITVAVAFAVVVIISATTYFIFRRRRQRTDD